MSSLQASVTKPRHGGRLKHPLCAAGFSLAIATLSIQADAACQYVINNQWSSGFTATLKITNSGTTAINGWNINWKYNGADRITSSWNATLTGSNPYTATNISWNGNLQPNQSIEFGLQGSKGSAPAEVPVINGTVCGGGTSSTPASSSAPSSIAVIPSSRSSSSAMPQGVAPLVVQGNKVTANGQPANLAGMSLFWSNTGWGGEKYYNAQVVSWLKSDWKANLVRVAMGTEADGGYLTDSTNKTRATAVIDAAIANNMYVIIDWHTHHAEDHKAAAITFFKEMASKYGQYNNVIYEVYNEPLNVSWSGVLKPYATDVIKEIRAIDPDNLIIVGTPNWSQDVDVAATDPITTYSNIAYTLHFYAGTHKQFLRDKAQTALNRGIALFVTEWGSVNADGGGGVNTEETNAWLNFMKTNGISHANWALNDKAEGASALVTGASANGGWTSAQLTPSGTLIRNAIIANNGGSTSSAATVSSSAPSSMATSSASSVNGNGCGSGAIFCLDFEDVAPGTVPAGFTQEGNGIAVVQGQQARSGNRSVKFTSTNYANSGYFKKTGVSGKHWGRLYYKMKTPVPNINTWLHGTFVAARSGSAEFRFVDTVQETSGAHQYLYNVEPGDVSLQGAYAYRFDDAWVCTEWFVDNQTQTYRFFRNGTELPLTRNGTQTNSTNLPGFAPVPATLDWLGFGLRTYQQSSGVEGWLDDVAVSNERIGCNTAISSSSVSSTPTTSSRSSSSAMVLVSSSSSLAPSSSSQSSLMVTTSSSRISSSVSSVNAGTWTLDATASYLNFVTTKNTHVIEAHSFGRLSGGINNGVATLAIDLSSVATGVELRDQRMRDLLFQVSTYPTATVSLTLPAGLIANLAAGSTSEINITADLNLHGITRPIATRVSVQKLTASRVLVQNLTPVLMNAPDHGLSDGVEALRAAVGIASISKAVPVDFTLVYDAR
ncbi:MAG TPA: cellulase family glycosylhydrolase [Cellvibrio sp.]|nr:cellulase family glycosylhydrolase [Cellvibrio sp.]